MANCLVLIDIQGGFFSPETKPVFDKVEKLFEMEEFDHIVATRFINNEDSPFVKIMCWNKCMSGESIQLYPVVEQKAEQVFEKSKYSCFTKEFKQYIKKNKINKIYLAGVDTDGCVLKSALDCFERGIQLEVLVNFCASTGKHGNHEAGIKVLERSLGRNCMNYELK